MIVRWSFNYGYWTNPSHFHLSYLSSGNFYSQSGSFRISTNGHPKWAFFLMHELINDCYSSFVRLPECLGCYVSFRFVRYMHNGFTSLTYRMVKRDDSKNGCNGSVYTNAIEMVNKIYCDSATKLCIFSRTISLTSTLILDAKCRSTTTAAATALWE